MSSTGQLGLARQVCSVVERIRALVLLGAPQKCLLAAASEIVIAPDKETEDAARATLELCLES